MTRFSFTIILISTWALIAGGCTSSSQMTFESPQDATSALVKALRVNDTKTLDKIFGDDGRDILASGDAVADRAETERFVAAYDLKHTFEDDSLNGKTTLIVGQNDWPFPVPLIELKHGYVFDTAAGKDEILNRRIGRNELDAEQVCRAIADAQRDYVTLRPMGGSLPLYARKVMSDPGTKNGLYWPANPGEPPSPLGPLVAQAAEEGYGGKSSSSAEPPAYHGYRYRLLTAQGEHARGGAMNYEVNGQLIGGFAVVAYPALYGNSGIMTFIMNHDGIVYERDLGPETGQAARTMTQFDPGPQWRPVPQNAITVAQ